MEEKEAIKKPSKIVLTNQNNLVITGISKVLTSTENLIVVAINGTPFEISGSKLTTTKLDVESGILEANGEILSMKFANKPKQKENIFKRIFG